MAPSFELLADFLEFSSHPFWIGHAPNLKPPLSVFGTDVHEPEEAEGFPLPRLARRSAA